MKTINNINFTDVSINDGFWKERYNLNKNISLESVYKRFEETGRFDALRFNYNENKIYPHIFFDSDVAKWIEAVGYLILKDKNGFDKEQEIIDALVDSMEQHQLENGYLNSHFIQVNPDKIFKIRGDHELYCAGHLIEAAISYYQATNKDKFLKVMEKYLLCIEDAFIINKTASFSTCGHEEIELALLKLYDFTNNSKYLDMAKFFINTRGTIKEVSVWDELFNNKYDQSEIPVRDLVEAEGHAVRAVYLYISMSELALKTNDKELFDACERVFNDIINTKLYITGGIGSGKQGEAFTVKYDLPNLEAYSESCAAIGLMLFALSMQQFGLNSKYGDVIEKIMYNNLLSSTSLDGKSFFYENPLEIHLASVNKETCIIDSKKTQLPIRHRLEVFDCSCCPPNINRIIASIGNVFFSKKDNDFIINQFGDVSYCDENINVEMKTKYPLDGKVSFNVSSNKPTTIYVRKPSWCDKLEVNTAYTEQDGYLLLECKSSLKVEIDFNMKPYFVESNPLVRNNNGRVALCYGPTVYCLEALDNPYLLNAVSIDINTSFEFINIKEYSLPNLKTNGFVDENFSSLYRKASSNKKEIPLLFKPYWTFANREETDMIVWVRKN